MAARIAWRYREPMACSICHHEGHNRSTCPFNQEAQILMVARHAAWLEAAAKATPPTPLTVREHASAVAAEVMHCRWCNRHSKHTGGACVNCGAASGSVGQAGAPQALTEKSSQTLPFHVVALACVALVILASAVSCVACAALDAGPSSVPAKRAQPRRN